VIGRPNVFSFTIDGGQGKALTNSKSEHDSFFNWPPDRRQLIAGHGGNTEDVVLIKDFR
jgi:hypothetical protein